MDEGLLLQVNLLYEVRKFKACLVVRDDHQLEGVGSLSPAYQLFSGCLLLIDDARVASILFYLSGHSALRLPTPSTCELGLSSTQNSAMYLKATKDKGFTLDFDGSLRLDATLTSILPCSRDTSDH